MLVRRRRGRILWVALVGAATVLGAGCAADVQPLTLDSVPRESTSEPDTSEVATSVAATPEPTAAAPTSVGAAVVGEEWTDATGNLVGLASECDNVSVAAPRAATGDLVVGIALQGLFSSSDGGSTWDPLASAEVGTTIRVRTVLFDPDVPDRVWLSGPGSGEGVYRSDDGAATFQLLGDGFGAGRLSVDLSDPERRTLLAVVEGQTTILRSGDGGSSWVDVSETLPYNFGEPRGVLVLDTQTHLVGSRNGPLAGVFRTTDGGVTWNRSYVGGIAGSPIVRSDGSIAWLLEYGGGVIVSRDGGQSWDEETGGGISWVSESVVELPDGRLATFGESSVLVSPDEGASWRPVGPPLPFRPAGFVYDEAQSAFYIWQSQCGIEDSYPVLPDSVMRLGFRLGAAVPATAAPESVAPVPSSPPGSTATAATAPAATTPGTTPASTPTGAEDTESPGATTG